MGRTLGKRLPRRGIVSAILDDYRCSTSRLVTLRRCFWPPLCLEISPNRKAGIGQGAGGTPHANGETASTTSPPMRAVLLKRLKRLAEKFEPPNVGPRTAVRLLQRAACGYRKTGVSLRLTWRCRLRSLEIESRLNIGSVAVDALSTLKCALDRVPFCESSTCLDKGESLILAHPSRARVRSGPPGSLPLGSGLYTIWSIRPGTLGSMRSYDTKACWLSLRF